MSAAVRSTQPTPTTLGKILVAIAMVAALVLAFPAAAQGQTDGASDDGGERAPGGPDLAAQTARTIVASGLNNPRHLSLGPDGTIYVAEAGVGGPGPCVQGPEEMECLGFTGSVTAIDDDGHERIIDGLPSLAPEGGFASLGPSDVTVDADGTLRMLIGLGQDPAVRDEVLAPAGGELHGNLVEIDVDGNATSVFDVAGFEAAENPDGSEVDSNPQAITPVDGGYLIVDAGANALLEFDGTTMSVVAVFPDVVVPAPPFIPDPEIPMQAVPTSVVVGPDGSYYVGQLTGFPFPPGMAQVFRVDPGSGAVTTFAGGFTNIIDIEFGPDGSLYVLQISSSGILSGEFDGALLKVASDGTQELVEGNLFAPGGLAITDEGDIYVSNCGICPGGGEVLLLEEGAPDLSLAYSAATDRSGEADLDGAEISGAVSVFVTPLAPEGDIERVEFSLDGFDFHTEFVAPYDFMARSTGLWDSSSVVDGTHTITATAFLADGSTIIASATFTTTNGFAPVESGLAWSDDHQRSDNLDLDGAVVDGKIWAYVDPLFPAGSDSFDRVDFTLDGEEFRTEFRAPYDFGGATNGWDTTTVSDGEHTIVATAIIDGSPVQIATATFIVANDGPPPPEPPGDLVDLPSTLAADGRFTTLLAAIEASNLDPPPPGLDFTVLAPTDDAFAALPEGVLDDLLGDPAALTDLLLYHIIEGEVPAETVVTLTEAFSLLGAPISIEVVDGTVVLNGEVNVIDADIFATNGVIHAIDGVLQPPERDLRGLLVSDFGRGSTEVPGPGDPAALSESVIDVFVVEGDDDEFCFDVFTSVQDPTVAHIHRGGAGEDGPVVVDTGFGPDSWQPDPFIPSFRTAQACTAVADSLADEILAAPQDFYFNIHSDAYPAGATREQLFDAEGLSPDDFRVLTAAPLLGSNEVPDPGDPDSGRGFVDFFGPTDIAGPITDNGELCYRSFIPNVGEPTAGHIHTGAAGVAGGVLVDLEIGSRWPVVETPNLLGWIVNGCVPVPEDVLGQIESDPAGYYVNVHNAEFPAGAVRAQLVEGVGEVLLIAEMAPPEGSDVGGDGFADPVFFASQELICWGTDASGVGDPTALYISGGDGVVVDFDLTNYPFQDNALPFIDATSFGCQEVDAATIEAIVANPGDYTINVDTAAASPALTGVLFDPSVGPPDDGPPPPTEPPDGLVDLEATLAADGRFTTLLAAVEASNLGPAPPDMNFTVLAPTDDAFAALPEGVLEGLLADPETLTAVLAHHLIGGEVPAETVVTLTEAFSLLGLPIAIDVVDGTVVLNGEANVIDTDILATNGVIHVIDGVLLPPPDIISLPNGFQPEGVAIGQGTDLFAGSLGRLGDDGTTVTGGAIYKADVATGEGALLVEAEGGKVAVGLAVDTRTNYLWVAGGPFGTARVYDGATGDAVADITLVDVAPFETLVNDVIIGDDAAYFTDSFRPAIYRVPLGAGGEIPDPLVVEELALGDDFPFTAGGINSNGIVAPPGSGALIIGHLDLGQLYRYDLATGASTLIDLGGVTLTSPDGLVLDGSTLYAVQNAIGEVAVIELSDDLSSGTLTGLITSSDFRFPTTADQLGDNLYVVNARFDVAPPPFPGSPPADPSLEFEVVRVSKAEIIGPPLPPVGTLVESIVKAPIVPDGDVAGAVTDLVINLDRSMDPSVDGRSLAAGDSIRITLPDDFINNGFDTGAPGASNCMPGPCNLGVLLQGWPQHPIAPPAAKYSLTMEGTHTFVYTALEDLGPAGPGEPGIKQAHLILLGFTNPAAGDYEIIVEADTGDGGATEIGTGIVTILPAVVPSINITSAFNEGTPNTIYQTTQVGRATPLPYDFLLFGADGGPITGVTVEDGELVQNGATIGSVTINAPDGATGQNVTVAEPSVEIMAPVLGARAGRLTAVFTAGSAEGAYEITFALDGGNAVTTFVEAVTAPDQSGALAQAVEAIGGQAALTALDQFQITASGESRIGYEFNTPDLVEATSTYTRTYSFDLAAEGLRVDAERVPLFEAFQFGPPQMFSVLVDGNTGGVTAGSGFLPASPLGSAHVGALLKQQRLFNPHLLLQQALAQTDTAVDGGMADVDGRPHQVVTVDDSAGEIRLFVDAETGLISKLETLESHPLVRDSLVEVRFTGWESQGSLMFPGEIELIADGVSLWTESRTAFDLAPAFPDDHFALPPEIAAPAFDGDEFLFGEQSSHLLEAFFSIGFPYAEQPGLAPATELAPGVNLLASVANTVVVNHSGGQIVVEAPTSPAHGSAIVDAVGQLSPDPISHVVTSHHHLDHTSGVRSVVAAGATAVVGSGVADFWADVLAAPSTVRPDALSSSSVTPVIEEVPADGNVVLSDDEDMIVTVHHVSGIEHAADNVFITIETAGQTFVYVADLYNAGFGATLVIGGPEAFFDAMRDLGLIDGSCVPAVPLTIIPAHGTPQTLADSIAELTGLGVDVGCTP